MHHAFNLLLLAAKSSSDSVDTGKGLSMSVAIVLAGVLLGMLTSLMPAKRTYEVKRPRED